MSERCAKDGRGVWRTRVSWTDPATGARRWKRVSERTRDGCRRAAMKLELGNAPPARVPTLAAWLETWLERLPARVRPSTVQARERAARLHLIPRLGRLRLDRLTVARVEAHYAELLAAGLAPNTVAGVAGALQAALNDAERLGVVAANPARRARLPRVEAAVERRGHTREDAARLLAAAVAAGAREEALYRLGLEGGLRRGELLGLRWEDVDLERGVARIERQRLGQKAGEPPTPPKTKGSRRPVPLADGAVDALARLRDETGGAGYVFRSAWGAPLSKSGLQGLHERLTRTAGVPHLPFHEATRHTCATLLLEAGVHPKLVQELLGHASISETLDTYSHASEGLRRQVAGVVEGVLEPERAKPVPIPLDRREESAPPSQKRG